MKISFAPATILALVLLTLLPGVSRALVRRLPPLADSSAPFDFMNRPPYLPGVPKPADILGYEPGDRHSNFRDQERVLLAMADAAKDRVRVVEYGKSVEGRPLRLFIVSAPENLSRLEEIRQNNLKLADPRSVSATDADSLVKSAPAILWINECIHGDETASFEAAIWTLYTLAASDNEPIRAIRQNAVIVLNPVFNPDGHERFVVWYNSIALGSPEDFAAEKSVPWALRGRFNHYRFDMNRDKLAQSQPETQQETAAQLSWYPQVYIDQHGQPSVYFFPPNAEATNINVDPARITKWTEIFGKANSQTFDHYGWNYVVRETFDFFAPIYLDSFASLSGAIGMTYETDGGGNLARRRDDGTISTLRDATAHHFETALTTLQTAVNHREALLHDFVAYRRKAIDDGAHGKFRRVVISTDNDPGRMAEFATLLRRVGVEVTETEAPLKSAISHPYRAPNSKPASMNFPAGSLVVDLSQPQGLLAKAFLEPDPVFSPEFVQTQLAKRDRNEKKNDNEPKEGYEFYDITAWSLPLTFGLNAYWTEDAPAVSGHPLNLDTSAHAVRLSGHGGINGTGSVAYLIRPDRDAAFVLALRLLTEGYRISALSKPATVGTTAYPRGTFIIRSSRNPTSLADRLRALAGDAVSVDAIGSSFPETGGGLGSDSVIALRKPRIAVATGEGIYHTSYGSVWFLLDRAGIPFTAVRADSLGSADLTHFNAVILPDGGFSRSLGKNGMAHLKDFVRSGGVLMGLGSGGTWFTEKDAEISSSRPVGEDTEENKDDKKTDTKKAPRPLDLPGGIFRASVDTTHFLGWGYPDGEIAVPLAGSTFLKPSKTGTNVVTFGKGARLSGFTWPNNTETLLENTAYVIDEPIGDGHALLYLDDPTDRALWPGLRRLFLAGLIYGTAGSPADVR